MINLTAKLDNDEFQRKLKEMRNTAFGVTNSIVKETQRIETAWEGVTNSLKGSEGIGAKLLQGLKPIIPQVEAIRQGVKGIKVDFENIPTLPPLQSLEETTASATRGFNALNFATQQLVREVPAATMGLHMFFLAISNNLPFFADAIKQVREENKALAASGKPTVSVFKQIIGSLFSWQTVLIAGITALTLYGKEIGNWVKGLFKGKEAIDAIAKAEQTLADIRRQGMLDAQEEVTQVKLAVKAMQDSNRSLDERKRAMRTLQDQYPEYFGKLREEQMLYGEVGDSVNALIQKMVALAIARKSFDKLVENEQKSTLLKDTKGYQDMMSAAETFTQLGGYKYEMTNSVGQRVKIKEQRKHYNHPETEEYRALLDAQEAFLDNLKEGGEEAEALFKEISDKYDGNVGAYIKAIEESNKKLTDEASALITTPDLSEDKVAAEEAEREAEERKRAIQRLNNDLSKEVQRTQREMDDAEIATIKDGIERKRREIQKGYERRAAEIDKLEADIKKAQDGTLTPEQKGHISYLRQANTDTLMAGKVLVKSMQDEVAQEATNAMDEYLISYGTFQEKILAITAKYQRLIANAQTEGERKTLEAERDAILAEYEVQASDWAKELVDKTTEQLDTMIAELQAQVDAKQAVFDALDSSDSDDAKKYREEINRLKAQIKELQQQLGKAKKDIGDDNWADATQVFQNISQAANDAADGIAEFNEGAASVLRTMAQLADTAINLIGAIQAVTTAAAAAAGTISAIEKASVILAVVGAAIQAVSVLINLFKGSNEVAETMQQFRELNEELERFRKLAQIDSVEGTIFGKDAFGNFSNNLRVMRDALGELEDSRKAIREYQYNKQKEYFEYLLAHYAHNAQEEAYYLRKLEELEQSGLKDRSLSDAIGAMGVQLGKNKTTTLAEQYPELFAGGEVSLEGLRKLKESDLWEKISQEHRDLIDELIADWEYYEEATAAVTDYLKDVFSDYGATITDVLVDSFKDGTDAVEAFGDAASNVIERLTKDFIYSTFIKDFVDQAEKDIEELNNNEELSSEERVKGFIDILKGLESNIQGQQDEMNAALADLEAAGYGYDSEASGRSTTYAKGFQTMSQETGSELNGRFTDIQGQTHRIAEAVEFCKSLHLDNLSQVQSINTTVAMIHNDTSLIAQHTKALSGIRDDINVIRRSMDNGII